MRAIERRSPGLRAILVLAAAATVAACGGSSAALAPGGTDGRQNYDMPSSAASAAPGGGEQSGPGASSPTDGLRIVYTGSLDLVVADVATALAKARTAVEAAGGYIGASQELNKEDRPYAVITYRIPAGRWADVIGSLRGLATTVVAEQTQATEVGGQIVDLEARIRNLRASETALLEIAKGAGRVTDLLEVQAQLTDVRGQIEQLDGQRTRLEDQVAYGTLVTTFGLEVAAVQEARKGWDPAKEVDSATATLIGIGQGLGSAAIWFVIVVLPLLLVLAVIGFVLRRLYRRFGPKPPAHGPIAGWGGGAVGSGDTGSDGAA